MNTFERISNGSTMHSLQSALMSYFLKAHHSTVVLVPSSIVTQLVTFDFVEQLKLIQEPSDNLSKPSLTAMATLIAKLSNTLVTEDITEILQQAGFNLPEKEMTVLVDNVKFEVNKSLVRAGLAPSLFRDALRTINEVKDIAQISSISLGSIGDSVLLAHQLYGEFVLQKPINDVMLVTAKAMNSGAATAYLYHMDAVFNRTTGTPIPVKLSYLFEQIGKPTTGVIPVVAESVYPGLIYKAELHSMFYGISIQDLAAAFTIVLRMCMGLPDRKSVV